MCFVLGEKGTNPMENTALHADSPLSPALSTPNPRAAAPTQPDGTTSSRATPAVWTGRALSGLFVLFMVGASITPKLLALPVAEASMKELGWPPSYLLLLGIIELSCVALYLIPKLAVFGAVLTTGLLGGAIATHLRLEAPLFSHILFPVYVGLFMWGGLWLRTPALRAIFPVIRR